MRCTGSGRSVAAVGLALLLAAQPAWGQDTDRIWGVVETTTGERFEGFLRWDRNEGSWADVLNGSKPRSPELLRILTGTAEGERRERRRVVELMGFRISWNEEDPDLASRTESGVRFGHLHRLTVLDEGAVELVLRSGEVVELWSRSTDLGPGLREFLIEEPGGPVTELGWDDIGEVTFGPVPAQVTASAPRLYGTVEDRWGDRYTGYLSWDTDEILLSDILNGEEDGRDREILFGDIAAIEREWEGSRVTLRNGRELLLEGTNDVDSGHRGVQISDPGLGMVEVEWDEFEAVRFHEPDAPLGYDAFDGGYTLEGTVRTRGGESHTGVVLWDGDESASWEFLDGEWRDVVFDVEFALIDRIERVSSRSARVTLRDGRVLELEDSNDVDEGNRGIFVAPEWRPGQGPADEAEWVVIPWDDFESFELRHPGER